MIPSSQDASLVHAAASRGYSKIAGFRPVVQAALGDGDWMCTIVLCYGVGPDFKKPQAPATASWIESTDPRLKREEADYGAWWNVFKDPVLDALVETAQQQNLTLQIAGLRVLEARAALGIATGKVYPQLQQTSGEVSLNDLSQNAPNQANADYFFYNYQVGFDAAWESDFWGCFRRGVESASASLLASIADYNDFLVTLTSEMARTYIVILTLEEGLEVARQNVEIQKRSWQIADVRFRNGTTTELDVQEARTLLFNTQAQIPALEIGLQAKNALGVLFSWIWRPACPPAPWVRLSTTSLAWWL